MAKIREHKDRLGRLLEVGDVVAVCTPRQGMRICSIAKLNPIMIGVKELLGVSQYGKHSWNIYPREMIKIDGSDATVYILTNVQ